MVNYTVEEKRVNLHGVESRLDEINSTIKDGQQTTNVRYGDYDKMKLAYSFYTKPDEYNDAPCWKCKRIIKELQLDITTNGQDVVSSDTLDALKYYDYNRFAAFFMKIYNIVNDYIHIETELDDSIMTIPFSEFSKMVVRLSEFENDKFVNRFTGKSKKELLIDFEQYIINKRCESLEGYKKDYMLKYGVKFYGREEVLSKIE